MSLWATLGRTAGPAILIGGVAESATAATFEALKYLAQIGTVRQSRNSPKASAIAEVGGPAHAIRMPV